MEKIKLNQDAGSMPLYSQIKQIILNDIKNGVYRLNETIPTEKQLQEILGVSSMTIRLAIDALVAEGYVVKERSKGTRVIYPKITESLNEVTNFSQEMRNKGIQYNIHSVEVTIVKAGEDIANALQIEEGVNVLRLHRVYYVNQEPLCSITSYLPAALNLSVDENVYRSSLYEYLEREKGIRITSVYEDIEVGYAHAPISSELQVAEHTALLLRTRTSLDQSGKPVEYVRSYYRAEKYKYSLTFGKA